MKEPANLEEIYATFGSMVYNLALSYVQNREEAEEITQDVFLQVHFKIKSFKGASSLSTWIYRIGINKSLDFIKAKQRKKRFAMLTSLFYEDSNTIKHDAEDFDHPGIQMEQKEAMERLFSHINQLPDKQKTALILTKIEQKTQNEAGEIMQLSSKAIESLIQRAKTNLDKKIKADKGIY